MKPKVLHNSEVRASVREDPVLAKDLRIKELEKENEELRLENSRL